MPKQESPTDHDQREVSPRHTTSTSRRRLLHLLGAGSVAGLAGCSAGDDGGTETGTEQGVDTVTGTETDTEKELQRRATIGIPSNVTKGWEVFGVSPYWHRMLEPLTWVTPKFKAKPWLAKDWERTGEKTWEFSLREDVTFHNGDPLNAEAVVFSIESILTDVPFSEFMQDFTQLKPEGIRKVDDLTVEFTNTDPFPNMPERLTHLFYAIQHPDSSKDQKWGGVIGTGPYKEEDIKPDEKLTVSAYEDYWREPPKMEELTIRYINDKNTRALALSSGEIDVGLKLSPSQFETLNSAKRTNAVAQPTPWTAVLHFNNTKSPTNDIKLRKALNYAVSQKEVIEGAISGIGDPARGPVPSMIWWSAHDDLPEYGPDKNKAKQLVEDSNYNGETLTIVSNSQPEIAENPKLTAQIFQQAAKDVGVDVKVKMMESAAFSDAENTGKGGHIFQRGSLTSHALAYDLLRQYTSKGYESRPYTFPDELQTKIDSLFKEGRKSRDTETTKEVLGKIQRIIVEDEAIMIPLYYKRYVIGANAKASKFNWHPLKRYHQWEKFELMK